MPKALCTFVISGLKARNCLRCYDMNVCYVKDTYIYTLSVSASLLLFSSIFNSSISLSIFLSLSISSFSQSFPGPSPSLSRVLAARWRPVSSTNNNLCLISGRASLKTCQTTIVSSHKTFFTLSFVALNHQTN